MIIRMRIMTSAIMIVNLIIIMKINTIRLNNCHKKIVIRYLLIIIQNLKANI